MILLMGVLNIPSQAIATEASKNSKSAIFFISAP
jgi:hypothetical protein